MDKIKKIVLDGKEYPVKSASIPTEGIKVESSPDDLNLKGYSFNIELTDNETGRSCIVSGIINSSKFTDRKYIPCQKQK